MTREHTLIVADVHQCVSRWLNKVIDQEQPNAIVCTGDMLDARKQDTDDTSWVLNYIATRPTNFTLLIGNHEVDKIERHNFEYGFSMGLGCPKANMTTFKDFCNARRDNGDNLFNGMVHVMDFNGTKVLLTHAGVSEDWCTDTTLTGTKLVETLAKSINKAEEACWARGWTSIPPIVGAVGRKRGGTYHVGGVLWRDNTTEPTCLPCHQIYGHTANQNTLVVNIINNTWLHVCLDGKQTIYGIKVGGKLTINNLDNSTFYATINSNGTTKTTPCKKAVLNFTDVTIDLMT